MSALAKGSRMNLRVCHAVLRIGLGLLPALPLAAQNHAAASVAAQAGAVVLTSPVRIVVGADEPQPVRLAADDLASDFAKVLGVRPQVTDGSGQGHRPEILIGEARLLPQDVQPRNLTAPESFSIAVAGSPRQVVLSGADMRGTIYAIYQFSEQFLGVDPMYYWTDHQPARRSRIVIPADMDKTFPAPVFRYRGFFLNDEDLLTGWAPGEKNDHTGISLAVWNKIYETILRLKGNMVVPGTWIFPSDPQIRLAGQRGLIITQHHAIPLGLNVARWPKDVPYNYTTHPEILERAWKDAVAAYPKNQEILWDVGLRGLSDVTYASMDPAVRNNDAALGELISKAIRDQMGIVRAVHPDARFVTDLWQEGARLAQEGYLKIPPEVMTVWADDGYGYLQDGGKVSSGQGAYYHVAMMNNRSNQLSEMVPVERIALELGRYKRAGATAYLLLNTSDIRPVTMTASAVMNYAWSGHLIPSDSASTSESPASAAADDYRRWAAEEFGAKAAPAIARIYQAYFSAPAHFGNPPHEYGDQIYHTEGRQLMDTYMVDAPLYAIPSQSPDWEIPHLVGQGFSRFGGKGWMRSTAKREVRQCADAQPRWDSVWKQAVAAESLVPPERREFYQASVLTMIAINRESNRMLASIAQSIQDADSGDIAAAQKEAALALDAVAQVRKAQAAAEYGKWKNWYRGDWLTGVYRTQQTIDVYADFLRDPLTHIAPPILWSGWEAYYHIMHYEGDRSADVQ